MPGLMAEAIPRDERTDAPGTQRALQLKNS